MRPPHRQPLRGGPAGPGGRPGGAAPRAHRRGRQGRRRAEQRRAVGALRRQRGQQGGGGPAGRRAGAPGAAALAAGGRPRARRGDGLLRAVCRLQQRVQQGGGRQGGAAGRPAGHPAPARARQQGRVRAGAGRHLHPVPWQRGQPRGGQAAAPPEGAPRAVVGAPARTRRAEVLQGHRAPAGRRRGDADVVVPGADVLSQPRKRLAWMAAGMPCSVFVGHAG
mmetsp:Transcript_2694/g.6706  ORF Transcript_2694/g.6706 Transcript_2694/m.6706 type:complete len:222 (-) Transcript_2694:428-1093(-)